MEIITPEIINILKENNGKVIAKIVDGKPNEIEFKAKIKKLLNLDDNVSKKTISKIMDKFTKEKDTNLVISVTQKEKKEKKDNSGGFSNSKKNDTKYKKRDPFAGFCSDINKPIEDDDSNESSHTDDEQVRPKKTAKYKIDLNHNVNFIPIKMEPFGTQWNGTKYIGDNFDDELTDKELRLHKVVKALKKIVYPEQRSKEWFEMRSGKITASDCGTVLGINHFEDQYKFILKKVENSRFKGGVNCYHGKKFEKVATMIYENRMGVKVDEYGMVSHKSCSFLGASPDGIVSDYKLDGIHKTKYVGRMIEIKCPPRRVIKKSGKLNGDIVPSYYYAQVQQQLEVCDLDECDFWQCKITEYDSVEDFIGDTNPNNPYLSMATGYEKGCLIQLIPLDKIMQTKSFDDEYEDLIYEDTAFLYPPKLQMSPLECKMWIADVLSKYNMGASLESDNENINGKRFCVDRVVYWKLEDSFCATIKRESDWMDSNAKKMEKIWNYVLFFRENPDKFAKLKEFIEISDDIDGIRKKNDEIMKYVEKLYSQK